MTRYRFTATKPAQPNKPADALSIEISGSPEGVADTFYRLLQDGYTVTAQPIAVEWLDLPAKLADLAHRLEIRENAA